VEADGVREREREPRILREGEREFWNQRREGILRVLFLSQRKRRRRRSGYLGKNRVRLN